MIDFSIITVCLNAADTIAETLVSVQRQIGVTTEHIIVDGASRDGTMAVVEAHRGGLAHVVSEPDRGLYDAMNKGLALAQGRLVGFLNADDALAGAGALRRLKEAHERAGGQAVYGDVLQITAQGRPARLIRGRPFTPSKFRRGLMPPHPAFYAELEAVRRTGGFDLSYPSAADFDLLLRLFRLPRFQAVYEPGIVTRMRLGGLSTRGLASTRAANADILRSCRANGVAATTMSLVSRYPQKAREVIAGRLFHLTGRKTEA